MFGLSASYVRSVVGRTFNMPVRATTFIVALLSVHVSYIYTLNTHISQLDRHWMHLRSFKHRGEQMQQYDVHSDSVPVHRRGIFVGASAGHSRLHLLVGRASVIMMLMSRNTTVNSQS